MKTQEKPLTVRCPNCKKTVEPNFNETTKRYACPVCTSPVDAQVLIEKKKRGERFRPPGSLGPAGRTE